MAYGKNVALPNDAATLVSQTGTTITSARVQNIGPARIRIMATQTETPPTDWGGALTLDPLVALKNTDSLADLFPHVTSPSYLYAISNSLDGEVSISHA